MPDRMTNDDIQSTVGRMVDEAQSFIDEDLKPDRELATDYYMGRPFKTGRLREEEGRSQVVSTDVRDTVHSMMPSLLRLFFGPERVVEFTGREREDEETGRQATEYINYIVTEDNPGFTVIYDAIMDALVRRLGAIKWWWDDSDQITGHDYTGLTQEDVFALAVDPGNEVEATETETGFNVTVTRRTKVNKVRIAAVPPEELLWNRQARNRDDALILVHSRSLRYDELLAMGYTDEQLESAVGSSEALDRSDFHARRHDEGSGVDAEDAIDPKTRPVRYDEAYVYLDVDGKGVSLWKVCLAGDGHTYLDKERLSHRPFALFCPYPQPHTMVGLSVADQAKDIQEVKSALQRGMLDSLALSIVPRQEAVEGMVNLKDLLNPEVGAIVRTRQPGMLREIKHSFVGADALAVLQYTDDILEARTGRKRGAMGIDADTLQSSTKAAVAATLTASQQQIEMVARVFAETGMKQLYKGILKTVIEHQDTPRIIRLRNEYVPVDPRSWDASMDVIVNVALGSGLLEDRMRILAMAVGEQKEILRTLGLNQPIVGVKEYRNALAKGLEMGGERHPEIFFKPVTDQDEQQMREQQAKQSDPMMLAAQAEMAKAQVDAQQQQQDFALKQRELALKQQEMELRDDRERDKQAADLAVRIYEIDRASGSSLDREQLRQHMELIRSLIQAETQLAVSHDSEDD